MDIIQMLRYDELPGRKKSIVEGHCKVDTIIKYFYKIRHRIKRWVPKSQSINQINKQNVNSFVDLNMLPIIKLGDL